ncbi:MAG: type VII toxin-antitoxin system HepT family RNase toxin [Acidimicrobiales bacterium]
MTPELPDREVMTRRLRLLADTLHDLSPLRGVPPDRLASEPITRAAVERLIQVIVDLAVDVNAHLAVSVLGRAPSTGRESFLLAADAGVLERPLAERLAPFAGMRNLLVHRYADIRLNLVAAAVDVVLDGFDIYVRAVASYLESMGDEKLR